MMSRLNRWNRGEVWRIKLSGFAIVLEQVGRDKFRVTYGEQVSATAMDYHGAARQIGYSIMHALAADGKLNNEEAR